MSSSRGGAVHARFRGWGMPNPGTTPLGGLVVRGPGGRSDGHSDADGGRHARDRDGHCGGQKDVSIDELRRRGGGMDGKVIGAVLAGMRAEPTGAPSTGASAYRAAAGVDVGARGRSGGDAADDEAEGGGGATTACKGQRNEAQGWVGQPAALGQARVRHERSGALLPSKAPCKLNAKKHNEAWRSSPATTVPAGQVVAWVQTNAPTAKPSMPTMQLMGATTTSWPAMPAGPVAPVAPVAPALIRGAVVGMAREVDQGGCCFLCRRGGSCGPGKKGDTHLWPQSLRSRLWLQSRLRVW